jgi:valyl-tRNA synthetase
MREQASRDERPARASNQQWYHDPVRPLDERGVLHRGGTTLTTGTGRAQATSMAPAYQPAEVERAVYQRWLDADVFGPDGAGSRADRSQPPYVITQPPPNVTGALHVGHALTSTIEDVIVRRQRMLGRPTLWLPGLDHASIAAQVVLDRILAGEGESRESLGRERYLERMRAFTDETRGVILGQERLLGLSLDWRRLRYTMDEGSAKAVRVAFKRLYDDGLAYRGERLVNWCPGDLTSVSDLEVIATPTAGTLWTVRYHFVGADGAPDPADTISVATTRPETILGDTAVAVHPDDERYRAAVGRQVLIPFVNRVVPIVADAAVERDFGTGAVKVTPAHDQTDFEIAHRHGLPLVDVMTDDGHINERGGPYTGLSRESAREQIVADLAAAGDLVGTKPHELILGRCQRSDDVIEPRLKTQWFIDVKPMAEKALAAVREGRTRIVPARFEKIFFHWLENIHDWDVSRQLWWGHRIPAWYCPDGHVTVSDALDGPTECDVCQRPAAELRQEEHIFDTWFSSGLWPFSTLGWPDDSADLRTYYPTTLMETGYDIIFFWVARMMMLGEWLTGRSPFSVVYLHGMVRDPEGAKMSKTKGNVVDPLGVISDVGADALRFALVNGTAPGADQRLGESRIEGARNFANKLWNAARFVLGARPADIPADAPLELPAAELLGPAEHWILQRCAATVEAVDHAYAEYGFGEATRLLYDAIWSEFCDWYLELAKVRLGDPADGGADSAAARSATWSVLAWVLDCYLRLLQPVMPHLTEEIWQRLPRRAGDGDLLIVANWPRAAETSAVVDGDSAAGTAELIELVRAMRTARAEAGTEPAAWLAATLWLPAGSARTAYADLAAGLARLAHIRPTLAAEPAELDAASAGGALVAIAGSLEARLQRSGADLEREQERLRRELARAQQLLEQAEARLADERFLSRAPANVVAAARDRAAELRALVERLAARTNG